MPKFKKGHNFGFKAENVPHNKVTNGEMKKKLVPAPYSRLSDQMFDMVSDKQRPQQKGRKLSCGPGAIISFGRGSKLEKAFQRACLMLNRNSKSNFA